MLSALVWIPVLGVILIGLLPRTDESAIAVGIPGESVANGSQIARSLPNSARLVALITTAITFALSIVLALQFDSISLQPQFQESLPWLEPLGLNYQLGLFIRKFTLIFLVL